MKLSGEVRCGEARQEGFLRVIIGSGSPQIRKPTALVEDGLSDAGRDLSCLVRLKMSYVRRKP